MRELYSMRGARPSAADREAWGRRSDRSARAIEQNARARAFAGVRNQVVKDKGLLFVLNEDSGVIAWADPSLDITADVVKRLGQP